MDVLHTPNSINRRQKSKKITIGARNTILKNIFALIEKNNSFLLIGHKTPDEDCYASLVAAALLLIKFHKTVTIFVQEPFPEQLRFLHGMCNYNKIAVHCKTIPNIEKPDVIAILDTPNPEMIAAHGCIYTFLSDPDIPKIELDHHFFSDAAYCGDSSYALVLHASSTCEILCFACYKLLHKPDILERYLIEELFARNLVLTLLTGMLGDAKMGNYLVTKREKKSFFYFSQYLNQILKEKTSNETHTKNIDSMDVLLNVLETMSEEDEKIYHELLKHELRSGTVGIMILTKQESEHFLKTIDYARFVGIIKTVTNILAENVNGVGISAYYDCDTRSNKIHCRIRASESARGINLHPVLSHFHIREGGGHPGAIAFRIKQAEVADLPAFITEIGTFIETTLLRRYEL